MNSQLQYPLLKRLLLPFCLFICLGQFCIQTYAQEKPPRPITVTVSVEVAQQLNFGTIIPNGALGGTVTVNYDGIRSCSGQIILPATGTSSSAALFYVYSLPGTLITISNGPTASLTGNHGGTIYLTIGESSVKSPFISSSASTATTNPTEVFIGGTLTIGSLLANPAGFYSGTFDVTFIQQ